jgi:2-polyprenyl-6-methoxyphenol hydroxylase-like FAD-dependent oxidoreductase
VTRAAGRDPYNAGRNRFDTKEAGVTEQIRADVVIVGGGVGGSSLAAVLQRQGISTIVIEREALFRDRVRGEGLHPWGYRQAVESGLDGLLTEAGANPLPYWQPYVDRAPVEPSRWDDDPENEYPEFGISHPRLQEASLAAAQAAGAVVIRPASARGARRDGERWQVDVERASGEQLTATGRLLVGADGRSSAVRRWLDVPVETDPEHHRFGGMLVSGVTLDAERTHAIGFDGGIAYLMPQGGGRARIYAGGVRNVIDPLAADRSGRALIAFLGQHLPEGSLDGVAPAGPIAFFPNGDIVPGRIAGPGWVLMGDAAGANDPSVGQGLSLTYRDVRRLGELLRDQAWPAAIEMFAAERAAVQAVVREHARWIASLNMEHGDAVAERREGVRRAKEADPTQGGFAFIYTRGPMGLTADAAARAHFFGEDLAAG